MRGVRYELYVLIGIQVLGIVLRVLFAGTPRKDPNHLKGGWLMVYLLLATWVLSFYWRCLPLVP